MTSRGSEPAALGDLFVFAETADAGVEWAVIAAEAGRLLVVPADTMPLVGSADVAVDPPEPAAPLRLRCGFAVWLDAGRFDPGRRTASLSPAVAERAAARAHAAAEGRLAATVGEREADVDPEYVEALGVLAEARAALAGDVLGGRSNA